MDKYFCKGCLALWKQGKWMECCPGCVAHREEGWTLSQVLSVYGQPLEFLIQTHDKDPGVFFPTLHRVSTCSRCYAMPTPGDIKLEYSQKYLENPELYPGYRKQQKRFLHNFLENPCDATWACIDPDVQRQLLLLPY